MIFQTDDDEDDWLDLVRAALTGGANHHEAMSYADNVMLELRQRQSKYAEIKDAAAKERIRKT